MKKNLCLGLILLGYGVPYAFLAMYADAAWRTMLGYVVLLAGMGLLFRSCGRRGWMALLLGGNLLSCVSSLLFVLCFLPQEWAAYFKPLLPTTLVLVLSVGALLLQLFLWRDFAPKQR